MKRIISGIMLTILLASMLMLAFSVQSIEKSGIMSNVAGGLAGFGGESGGFEVQSGSIDWWPMFHHDLAHTGYSTSTAPNTNQTLWSYTTEGRITSSPAVTDGKVYIASDDRKVYALNASTGTLIWNYQTVGGMEMQSSPAVANGKVYIGGATGKVYALNASTGTLIWSYQTGPAQFWSSPAVGGGVVYVGSGDRKVYALNASTGTLIWNYTSGGQVLISPAVVDGRVYTSSYDDRKVFALNASTGALIWSRTSDGFWYSSPAVADGKVYIGTTGSDSRFYALNASTGAFIWSYNTGGIVGSSPAVADGKVYIGSAGNNNVYALNSSTGALIWYYTTGGYVRSGPAIAGGKVYVGTYDKKVYALNASTGAYIWSYTTGDQLYCSSPAVADGKLYIGSCDKKVYAFGSHDVSITSVTSSITEAYSGQIVNITVVSKNEGTFNETFNVRAYYDSNLVGTKTVTNLPPEIKTTLVFSWNTSGIAGGYYTISANASIVSGETHTADNNFTDGTIKITSPVRIAEVIPCNQTGYPKSTFHQCAMAYFKVTINSTALIPQNTLITINLYDNASITIGVASFQGLVLPGISTIIFGLPIPTTATIGTATIYANCYTDWPSQGGFPHCPEKSATLEITGP